LLSKNLGFSGKGTIHPKQIPIMNEIFSPSVDEINYAKKVIDAFDKADGGLVVVDGKLIEKPVLRSVKRVLANVDETLS
jgi:citrate lyase beta subunit